MCYQYAWVSVVSVVSLLLRACRISVTALFAVCAQPIEDPELTLTLPVSQVYHNYGFDRHVLYNEGINAQGLGGDTMHMARLWRAGR